MSLIARSTDPFRAVHVVSLALCLVFLPWSGAFLSIAQMIMVANWLARGVVRKKLQAQFAEAFTTGPSLVFLSFFGIHVLGLLWTTDLKWGVDLVRILLPVLTFGLVLSTTERLTPTEYRNILLLGAWAAVLCFLFGVLFSGAAPGDYRSLSIFISHIRLALLLCLAVVIFLYYRGSRPWITVCQWIAAAWAVYAINALGSIQGLVILAIIGAVMLWRRSTAWRPVLRWSTRVALLVVPALVLALSAFAMKQRQKPMPADLAERVERTAGGETYSHDVTNTQTENGTHVWTYIAWDELRRTWLQRSARSLDSLDDQHHELWSTAVRYMASKGLRKDSVGVMALTAEDIAAIERGTTNMLSGKRNRIRERVEEVLFEMDLYRSKGIVSGHSVSMRFEFQKTGWAIAQQNWLCGVGTGDTQRAFDAQYIAMDSKLDPEWRLRAHNQYLTLWISFGVFGLLWCLFTWWWPAWKLGAWSQTLFIAWAIAFAISCFTDDTVETQPGATFFALYYAIFVFASPRVVAASRT